MENGSNRHVGRPKSRPQTRPLVLEDTEGRVRLEVEVADSTAEELGEYVRWIELSSAIATSDARSKTVDYALKRVFRHDRLWQEHRKGGGRVEAAPQAQTAPSSPPALPPPALSGRVVPSPAASAATSERRPT
jgi:hypothetical protein